MTLFTEILPTYLNKAGQWMLNLGAGLQSAMGAEGSTLKERLTGMKQKLLSVGAALQEKLGATSPSLPERFAQAGATAGKAAYNIAKDIFIEAPARASSSIALSVLKEPTLTPTTPAEKFFFGNEPIQPIGQKLKTSVSIGKSFGGKVGESLGGNIGAQIGGKVGSTLAPLVVIGSTILDLTPFIGGGKKPLTQQLLKTKTAKEAEQILLKTNLPEELAQKYAPRFAKAGTIEEVSKQMANLVNDIKQSVIKERGFVASVRQQYPTLKVAGQYIPRSTDELAIKAKNLIRDNIEEAERIARNYTDDKAVATGVELIKYYSDLATQATDKATKDLLADKAAELANDLARRLTAEGRTIQAASILGRLTPEGQVKFAAREIQKYNELVEKTHGGFLGLKKKIPELTGKQAQYILDEMKAISNMAEGEEKAIRFQKLQDYISRLVPSPLYQKWIAVWKAGLLTGLKTSGVNIFSNTAHFGLETIKDIPASAIDSVVSLFTGKRTLTFTLQNIPEGFKEGFEKGWRYVKTGYSERNVGVKYDYFKVHFGKSKIAQGLQKYEETIFGIIGAEDQPFYYGAKARSLYDQAIAAGKTRGLKGEELQKFVDELVQNPTNEMLKYATLDAETAVFQQDTVLGKIAKQIQKAPGGEIVVPFGRTPSAIATQIINYTPIGIAITILNNIGKGKFDQRLFSQGLGRGLTGTAILAIGAALYKKGLISLAKPSSEREEKLWELEGRQANSIKINGKWRQAQVLGPAGFLLIIGGHFQKALEETGSPTHALVEAFAGASKTMTDQTFLKGLDQAINSIIDPRRYAVGYLHSTIASTIPTLIADIARATDTKERRAETLEAHIQSRIPIVRQKLEPQITVLGQEKPKQGSFMEILADPTRPTTEIIDPAVLELRRLWNNGYKISPTLLGNKNGYDVLTPAQNTELWKTAGTLIRDKLNSLLKKDAYYQLDDEQKAKVIDNIVDKAKIIARAEMVLKVTEGLEGEALIQKLKALKASGLLTKEVYLEYQRLR